MATKPPPPPPTAVPGFADDTTAIDAADQLSQLAAGNANIITHPHLLSAMANANATPAQAQAINQFVGGMSAGQRASAARATGSRVTFTLTDQANMTAMGIKYSDVMSDPTALPTSVISNPAADGSDLQNAADTTSTAPKKKSGGGFSFNPWTDVKKVVKAASPVLNVLNKGWQYVDNQVSQEANAATAPVQDIVHGKWSNLAPDVGTAALDTALTPKGAQSAQAATTDLFSGNVKDAGLALAGGGGAVGPDVAQQMHDDGYDPQNPFSVIAFQASGKQITNYDDLKNSTDPDTLNSAIEFNNDPAAFNAKVMSMTDPNAQKQALDQLQSKQFQDLSLQLRARTATIGNYVTNNIGIDPVKHPELQQLVSGGVDTVASFIADPTNAALGIAKSYKLAKYAVNSLDDGQKVENMVNGTTKGVRATNIRNGVQSLIDNTTAMREASAAGDDAALAAAHAKLMRETPGLAGLQDDFLGTLAPIGFKDAKDASGDPFIWGKSEPITTMEQASKYLSSKIGMVRYLGGKVDTEGTLMPGALSSFGYRKVFGAVAAANASASVNKITKAVAKTADATIDLKSPVIAERVMASTQDAVSRLGKVLAGPGADDAAVADATQGLMSSAARGQATFARQTVVDADGNPVARGLAGMASPRAGLTRLATAAQHFTRYLPRDVSFTTDSPKALQNVFRYAGFGLTDGDRHLLAAKYATGDESVRKQVLLGMQMQVMHAAGLGTTEAGRKMIDDATSAIDDEAYSITGGDKITVPETGDEMRQALFDTQVNPTITLARFVDIQRAAAKIGIFEATAGRAFQSQLADHFMGTVKAWWLISGTNIIRNVSEDLFGAALRGEYGDVARAKAQATQLDAGRLTEAKQNLARLQREAKGAGTTRDPSTALAIEKLEKQVKAATLLPQRTKMGALVAQPFLMTTAWLRKARIASADPELGLKYIADLDPDVAGAIADNWAHAHANAMLDPDGSDQVNKITKAGFLPKQLKMVRKGFGPDGTDGTDGAVRFSAALAQIVDGNPDHFDAIVRHIETPDRFDLGSVVDSLKAPQNAKRVGQMTTSTLYKDADGVDRRAVTDSEKDLALHQLAGKQMVEVRTLLSNPDGALNQPLIDYIRENGAAPKPSWVMQNLEDADRPTMVNAPMFEAVPTGAGITNLAGALSQLSGTAYQMMIERPLNRMSTMPIFLSNYGKARAFLDRGENTLASEMRAAGLDSDVIEHHLTNMGLDMAYNRTVKYVDDPGLRTQMDVVGRNFFAFSRATQAFVRRWGNQLVEDPARARKAMLAYEGGVKTGIIYPDANGDQQFMFPGSGYAINAINRTENALGFHIMRVPSIVPNLTSSVQLLNSGLQNPLQFSLTPMVNIPMKTVQKLFPQHQQAFDEVDNFFNGSQSSNTSILGELEPTVVKKFSDALSNDDKNSMLADATRTALLHLGDKVPDSSDPTVMQNYIGNLHTQIKNQLVLKAMFGLFSPAPPGTPTEDTAASKADWFYGAAGAKNLDDEYKEILNQSGGDVGKASQIWAELHPDKLAYTVSTTQSSTKSAEFSATQAAQSWLDSNLGFMQKYGGQNGVAAYFIPVATQSGDFDLGAYHAEEELGLRQHKSTADYYADVVNANATNEYFDAVSSRDAQITANPKNKTQIDDGFAVWKKDFIALHPSWSGSMGDFSTEQGVANGQLATLKNMVDSPDLPSDLPVGAVKQMLAEYNAYHAYIQKIPGSTNADNSLKAQAAGMYSKAMTGMVADNPQLKGIYQGIFRIVDNSVLDPLSTTTSGGSSSSSAAVLAPAPAPQSSSPAQSSSAPLFTSEGPDQYNAAYANNKQFAKPPTNTARPYQTVLSSSDEQKFQQWVKTNNVPFDPTASTVDYDMRGYWKSTGGKNWQQGDHFPDTYKTPYDTTFSNESMYATKNNPFKWQGDNLVDTRNGKLIFSGSN